MALPVATSHVPMASSGDILGHLTDIPGQPQDKDRAICGCGGRDHVSAEALLP
mgnify:CR=1 FL=1